MLRLLSRSRKVEGGEDEPKKYKKANLGLANEMYYNDELKMWVERGKEDEARAEKAKMTAPPPSVSSLSAASSATSLVAMGENTSTAAPPNVFARDRNKLASRYVSTIPTAPGSAGTSSPAMPGPKALLPGGGSRLPGIPAIPGNAPSLFMPTPPSSEHATDALGGSEADSVLGLDSSLANSRNVSQRSFFVPGQPLSTSTTTDDLQGLGAAGDSVQDECGGVRTSSGSTATEQHQGAEGAGTLLREDDSQDSSRLPAFSGPSNVSFASWQRPPVVHSAQPQPHPAEGEAAADSSQDLLLARQGSSADVEADAKAEVSSAPELCPSKQQQPENTDDKPWMHAHSNGQCLPDSNGWSAHSFVDGSSTGAGQVGDAEAFTQNQSLMSQTSWDSRPVQDPLAAPGPPVDSAGGEAATWGSQGWEGAAEGLGWQAEQEGGYQATQHQQQQNGAPDNAMAYSNGLSGGQQGGSWDGTAGWQVGWAGGGVDAATAADPEGGAGGSGEAAAFEGGAHTWQQDLSGYPAQQPSTMTSGLYDHLTEQQAAAYSDMYQPGVQQSFGHNHVGENYSASYSLPDQPALQQQQGPSQQAVPASDGSAGYQSSFHMAVGAEGAGELPAEAMQPVHPVLPGIAVSASQGSGSIGSPANGHSGSRASNSKLPRASIPGSPGMGALLPQPPRMSMSTQPSLGPDGQAEAAAVILSTTAAAGDASMLTAVRPSSPYARTVSPLSRTSTTMLGDAAAAGGANQSSGGFPIPSPPSHGGLLGSRAPSCNMFLPGAPGPAAVAPVPWQPLAPAEDAPSSSQNMYPAQAFDQQQPEHYQHHQPQQQQGWSNGYDSTMYGQWQPQPPQQQQQAAVPPVPPFVPGLLESLPRDVAASWRSQKDASQPTSATASAKHTPGSKGVQRAHPYDQFISQALAQVDWRAVHFKQPGKLNKLLPWEAWEMEKALKEQAEQQAAGVDINKSPFWCRQMEFRQKLPPGSVKPSASEPAAMPSHAVQKPTTAVAAQSSAAQPEQHMGWQQQPQQPLQQQHWHVGAAMSSPLTPARAATTGASGAVAAEDAQHPGDEPTPTSRFAAGLATDKIAQQQQDYTAAAVTETSAAVNSQYASGEQHQTWVGWQGYEQQQQEQQYAVEGSWDPSQYGQGYDQQQYYEQCGGYIQGTEVAQQYDAQQGGQWHQEADAQAGMSSIATWGSPDAEVLEAAYAAPGSTTEHQQQQQHLQTSGVDAPAEAQVPTTWDPSGIDASSQQLAAQGDVAELHSSETVAAACTARISTSSLGLESQPSTGKVAAAAARQLVSDALSNIMQQHAVPEDVEAEAAGDGWEGDGDIMGVAVSAEAGTAEPADGNLEDLQQEAGPVSAAWARLSQQFHAAAEAAAAMGLLDKEVAEYKDYFVQYGDYLLGALPRPALQQAGLLHDEPLSSTQVQQQQQQGEDEEEAGDAEDDALYEEFGMLQLKNDTSGDMFEAMGFDLEALLACVAEA